jgi:hypothetical protein
MRRHCRPERVEDLLDDLIVLWAYWRPAAVLAAADPDSWPGRVLTEILGQPTFRVGGVLAWRL